MDYGFTQLIIAWQRVQFTNLLCVAFKFFQCSNWFATQTHTHIDRDRYTHQMIAEACFDWFQMNGRNCANEIKNAHAYVRVWRWRRRRYMTCWRRHEIEFDWRNRRISETLQPIAKSNEIEIRILNGMWTKTENCKIGILNCIPPLPHCCCGCCCRYFSLSIGFCVWLGVYATFFAYTVCVCVFRILRRVCSTHGRTTIISYK